jgi:hypothetical protein
MSQMINLNYAEFKQVLDFTPHDQNIFIGGDHGIGKSQIVEDYYSSKGFEVVPVFLGQMSDAGDLLGLPDKKEITVGEATQLIMDFLPPAWWQNEKPFCLFLDELNRGRPEIMQVIFDLCLNKRLGGRKLPEGSVVIAAANVGSEYQVTDLDPALVSRFNVYRLAPEVSEWLEYATTQGVDKRVTSFIQNNEQFLDPKMDENADSLDKTPDRRAWFKVNSILADIPGRLEDIHFKLLSGVIGQTAVGIFNKHLSTMIDIDAKKLLYAKSFKTLESDLMIMTMQDLIYLNGQVMNFVVAHQDTITAKQMIQDKVCKNFGSYLNFLIDNEYKEVVADMVNSLEAKPEVAAMLISDPDVMNTVIEFIESVKVD